MIGIFEVIDTTAPGLSWESIVAVFSFFTSIVALCFTYRSMLIAADSAEASKVSARAAEAANKIFLYPRRLAVAQAVSKFLVAALAFDADPSEHSTIYAFAENSAEANNLFGSDTRPQAAVQEILRWGLRLRSVRGKLKQRGYQDEELYREEESLHLQLKELQAEADMAFAPYLRLE